MFAKDICSVDFKIQLRTQDYSIFRRALEILGSNVIKADKGTIGLFDKVSS